MNWVGAFLGEQHWGGAFRGEKGLITRKWRDGSASKLANPRWPVAEGLLVLA